MVLTVGEDYGYPFRNVMDWFGTDDASFINLEGPLCEDGDRAVKQHVFRGPPEFVNILTECSVEAVTLANNHAYDFREAGYESTKSLLTEAGVPYVEKDASMIFTTESGLTIGLYAVTYEHLDKEEIVANISRLAGDETVDLVIFAPHWGIENTYRQNQTQQELAYAAIDAGAHIVWGSHTHVLQPIEAYKGGIIFYSLANFSFGGNAYPPDYDTVLVQQEVLREPDGTVRLGELTLVPCSVSGSPYKNDFQPTPYPQDSREYERVMEKLNGTFRGANLGYE
jgi:poly-gamma-glutamate synthesis protein (capsule biosynthesis protein)